MEWIGDGMECSYLRTGPGACNEALESHQAPPLLSTSTRQGAVARQTYARWAARVAHIRPQCRHRSPPLPCRCGTACREGLNFVMSPEANEQAHAAQATATALRRAASVARALADAARTRGDALRAVAQAQRREADLLNDPRQEEFRRRHADIAEK